MTVFCPKFEKFICDDFELVREDVNTESDRPYTSINFAHVLVTYENKYSS